MLVPWEVVLPLGPPEGLGLVLRAPFYAQNGILRSFPAAVRTGREVSIPRTGPAAVSPAAYRPTQNHGEGDKEEYGLELTRLGKETRSGKETEKEEERCVLRLYEF